MSYTVDGYITDRPVAANALPAERVGFIRRTYAHLVAAILAFAGIEALLLRTSLGEDFIQLVFGGGGKMGLLLIMVLFIGGGYLARYWAHAATTRPMQYAGLALYVLLEVIIFLPLLYVADHYFAGQFVIQKAGILTLTIFTGLTLAVFLTRQDFSFLGPILAVVSFGVLGVIICAMLFGLSLGLWFSFAMVGLAAAYIIYDTSNVLHNYRTDQHVGAALELFASVALMFYYILRIFMSERRS